MFINTHCDLKTLYKEDGSGNPTTTAGCCHPLEESSAASFSSLLGRGMASSMGKGGGFRISGDSKGITALVEEEEDGRKASALATMSSCRAFGARFCSLVGDFSPLGLV